MVNPITIVNGSIQTAPAPSLLQQTGAFISQGGTTLAAQQYQLLTQLSDLTNILTQPAALSSLSWSGGIVTATTVANHGLPQGEIIYIAIAGASPSGYNGTFPCTITGAATFTYQLSSNPGSESGGTWVVGSANVLLQMNTMFFGNGTQQATYVLELGAGSPAAGVSALSTFIAAQPNQIFYGYLVPRVWAKEPTFITFASTFTSVEGLTYFWTTMDLQNYVNWLSSSPPKSVVPLIENPATAVWPANVLTALSWSGAANTISSGTYNNTTGLVTLTMSAGVPFGAGTPITLSSLTGNGGYASLDGNWTVLNASGTTVTFNGPAGLGSTTAITGGTLTAGGVSGTISATTTTNHGVSPGQWFQLAGCVPVGYNSYYLALEGTSGDTLVASLPTNPGTETTLGTLVASTVASPGIGSTEFDLADPFWSTLSWNPSSSNRVPPLSFVYMPGATPFSLKGNGSILATLLANNINYVGTGAEGGITNAILRNGRTLDGNQFNYWYSIDWVQIQCKLAASNAVINGSNNSLSPLYYNQQGINTLQSVIGNVISTGIGAGLILGALTLTELDPVTFANNLQNGVYSGQAVVNAIPFATYIAANPANYPKGLYGGFSVAFTPQVGFQQIIINLTAVQFGTA